MVVYKCTLFHVKGYVMSRAYFVLQHTAVLSAASFHGSSYESHASNTAA